MHAKLPIAIDTLDSLYAQHLASKVRILAVSGNQRVSFAPTLPTFRESGLKIDATGWNSFFAPSSMPSARVQQRELTKDLLQAVLETCGDTRTDAPSSCSRGRCALQD